MKEIRTKSGHSILVDDSDYEYLNQWKWAAVKNGNTFYATRRDGVKNISMHRQILGLTDPKIHTDHIDHNGLNNQRSNLRECTNQENLRNRQSNKVGTSRYKGVSFCATTKKWVASIGHNGKKIIIGCFDNEHNAARAYNEQAVVLFGEFVNLNSIPEGATTDIAPKKRDAMKLFSMYLEMSYIQKIKNEVRDCGYDSIASFIRKLIHDYFKNK